MHCLLLKTVTLLACCLLRSALASHLQPRDVALPNVDTVQQYFGSQLSKDAAVYFPNSPEFGNLVRQMIQTLHS